MSRADTLLEHGRAQPGERRGKLGCIGYLATYQLRNGVSLAPGSRRLASNASGNQDSKTSLELAPKTMTPASVITGLSWLFYISRGYCQQVCSSEFEPISASDYVARLSPGWNLGNSLDAFPDEDSWNNPAVTEATFSDVRDFGFNSVRIPSSSSYQTIRLFHADD